VVDSAGRLVGMITRADLIQAFAIPDEAVRAD
jgi:CBS domain-containing protein